MRLPRERRRPLAATLVVLLSGVLAGCGGLPLPRGTSAVRSVSVGQVAAGDADLVRRIPHGPEAAATPAQVVAGFLAAGADPDVAREFLTPGNGWDPLHGTTVFSSSEVAPITYAAGMAATVATITPQLTIGEDGATRPGGIAQVKLQLVHTQGVWRILTLPSGTLLQAQDLGSSYHRALIAWLSPDRRNLVRESVLLPGDSESLLPDVVRALLLGPDGRLALAGVTTVLPGRLSVVRAVQVGTEVDIDLQAQGPTPAIPSIAQAAARAQVAATLLALPGVTSVRVDISGQPLLLDAAGDDTPVTAADTAGFDRDVPQVGAVPLTATGTTLAPLRLAAAAGSPAGTPSPVATRSTASPSLVSPSLNSPSTVSPSTGSPSSIRPVTPSAGGAVTALAVAADGQQVAELRAVDGGQLPVTLTQTTPPVALAQAGPWTSVAWGPNSSLWLVRAGVVFVAVRDRAPVAAAVPSLPAGLAFASLLIEPDGVHAVGVTTGSGELEAGLVDAYSDPPSLTDVHPIAPTLSSVGAVAVNGSGATGVQLLVQAGHGVTADGGSGLTRVDTGAPDPDPQVEDSSALLPVRAACPNRRPPVSLTALPTRPALASCDDGTIRELQSDGRWTELSTAAAGLPSLAAYPLD